jgi:type I restriction enzyme, S subunit
MSEVVPEGWENLTVQDAFELGRGRVISKEEIRDNAGKYPVYSSQSTNNGKMGSINTYDFDGEYVTWTTDGAYAGTVFYRNGKFSCTNVCGTVRDKNSHQVDMKFVSEYLSTVAKNHVSYVGNPKLMNGIFGEIKFLSPPLPEQKKIASILTSVDEVIEKTQSQIDKLQDLKKGTMNELLTKGIGHTEFKDSELGRIPKSWEEMTLGAAVQKNIITDIQDGNHGAQHPKASDYVKDGIPFVMASNLKGGVIDVESTSKIPKEIYENLRIGFAKTGDVLLTHKATIGLVAIVNENTPEVMCTPQVTYYRIGNKEELISKSLFYWFQSDLFQNEIMRLSGQSTRNYIGITAQKNLLVRIPPMDEQIEMIKILESIDHDLLIKMQRLDQTQSLKKSLMQDLLTGKVRVSVN